MINSICNRAALSLAAVVVALPIFAFAQGAKGPSWNERQKLAEAAQAEGKLVVSIPPRAEFCVCGRRNRCA